MYCSNCGKELKENSNFCANCGAKQISIGDSKSSGVKVSDNINEPIELAKKEVKESAIAGYVVAGLSGILAVISIATGTIIAGMSGLALVDAIIFAALAYGVSKYNRSCAVAILALYALEEVYNFSTIPINSFADLVSRSILPIIFLILFSRGIVGSFEYHKLSK